MTWPEWGFSWPVFWLFHFLLMPLAVAHVLLFKRLPQAAFGWMVLVIALPLAGTVIYGLFGVNRIRRRAQRLGRGMARDRIAQKREDAVTASLPAHWQPMAHASHRASGLPLTTSNSIQHLHTGEALFPAMLARIEAAQESIYLSSYMFDLKGIGEAFVEALIDASERGVDVRVLIDGVGDRLSYAGVISKLSRAGIAAQHFLPPRLWPPAFYLNLRNHRKILVVDRKIAFTGGINVTQKNTKVSGNTPSNDDHFEFRGPVVNQLLAVFAEDWAFASDQDNDIELPDSQSEAGDSICRAIPEGPDRDEDQILMLMTTAVSLATRQVTLFSPYFLPMQPLSGALCSAALRGVEVRVLIPRESNYPIVDWACRHNLPDLLEYGVKVYAIPPPFLHSKLFLVDGLYAMVGSTNVDPRSLQLNFEVMVELYDGAFVEHLERHADTQFAKAQPVKQRQLESASLPIRLRDALAALWAPYL